MYIWGVRQAIVMILEKTVVAKLLEAMGCQQDCNPWGRFSMKASGGRSQESTNQVLFEPPHARAASQPRCFIGDMKDFSKRKIAEKK